MLTETVQAENSITANKDFSAKLSYLMKLLSRKYEPKISINYFSFDLNLHSKAYRNHDIQFLVFFSFPSSFLSTVWLIPKLTIYAQTLPKRHSHKEI